SSNKNIDVLPDFPSLRKNAIPNAGMRREERFESMLKGASSCFHLHMATPTRHGPQWPRYQETDRHWWLPFRRGARVPLRLVTLLFALFGDARLRLSVGPGGDGPASSATTALATQTICGSPLNNSFQVLPASLDAYSFPLRVPK